MVLKAVSLHELYRVLLDRGVRKATDRLLGHDLELQQLYQRDGVRLAREAISGASRAHGLAG